MECVSDAITRPIREKSIFRIFHSDGVPPWENTLSWCIWWWGRRRRSRRSWRRRGCQGLHCWGWRGGSRSRLQPRRPRLSPRGMLRPAGRIPSPSLSAIASRNASGTRAGWTQLECTDDTYYLLIVWIWYIYPECCIHYSLLPCPYSKLKNLHSFYYPLYYEMLH